MVTQNLYPKQQAQVPPFFSADNSLDFRLLIINRIFSTTLYQENNALRKLKPASPQDDNVKGPTACRLQTTMKDINKMDKMESGDMSHDTSACR